MVYMESKYLKEIFWGFAFLVFFGKANTSKQNKNPSWFLSIIDNDKTVW